FKGDPFGKKSSKSLSCRAMELIIDGSVGQPNTSKYFGNLIGEHCSDSPVRISYFKASINITCLLQGRQCFPDQFPVQNLFKPELLINLFMYTDIVRHHDFMEYR